MSQLSQQAMRGSMWAFTSAIIVRTFSFLSQLILGWLLIPEQFGLYGTVISITAIFACFQDNGVGKLMIHKTHEFDRYSGPAVVLSVALNSLVSILFLGVGYFYSQRIEDGNVMGMMAILALTNFLGMSLIVSRAELTKNLQFKTLAKIDTVSNGLNQLLMIPLALLGAGPYSFVIPAVISKIYLNFKLRQLSSINFNHFSRKFWKKIIWEDVLILLGEMPWIIIAALAMALIQKGDYLVLGWYSSPAILGVYFFGFQLTVALSTFLTTPLSQIFMPSLAKLNGDLSRQMSAYHRSIKAISLITYPGCYCGAIMAGPLIHLVWNGKWDQSIFVVQLLLLVLPVRFLCPVGRALLEARGRWKASASLLTVDGLGTCVSAYLGAKEGGLAAIVVNIATWRFFIGALQVVVIPILCGAGLAEKIAASRKLSSTFLTYLIISSTSLGLSAYAFNSTISSVSVGKALGSAIIFSAIYAILVLIVSRKDALDLFNILKGQRNVPKSVIPISL